MSLHNPDNVVTEERLAEFYQQILPYMGGMPDVLANKFNRADLYSTDEKLIGRWIDGKPLYQKVVDCGALPNNTTKRISTGLSGVEVINYFGISKNNASAGTSIALPYSNKTGNNCIAVSIDYNNPVEIAIVTGMDRSSFTSTYVTIQYTKTTDSAVEIGSDTDYSTTEKIVGTWIDGKPIWQKTVDCGALPNSATKEVDHNISNLDDIINYYGVSRNPTDGNRLILPYLSVGNLSNGVALTVNDTKIRIGTGSSRSSYTSTYVTIQYTKTSS